MMIELQGTYLTLKIWKKNPNLTKREIGIWYYPASDKQYDKPFSEEEIELMKKFLENNNPTAYHELFS